MKRTTLALILGLMVFGTTAASFATFISTGGGVVGLIFAGVFGGGDSNAVAPSDKQSAVPSNEIVALNNNPQCVDLLKQTAGGALNTIDILK